MRDCPPIAAYLEEMRALFRYQSWTGRRVHEEIKGHLMEAAGRHRDRGLSDFEAQSLAIEEFGAPDQIVRSFIDEGGPVMSPRFVRWSTPISAALLLPALVFIVANVLKFSFGAGSIYDGFFGTVFDLRDDTTELIVSVAVVTGPLVALLLIALASMNVGFDHEDHQLRASIAVRITKARAAIVGLSLLSLGALVAYLLVENLPCLVGGRVQC